MAAVISFASPAPTLCSNHRSVDVIIDHPHRRRRISILRRAGRNSASNSPGSSTHRESEPQNALLKLAWHGSELLGIAASFFRSASADESSRKNLDGLLEDGPGAVDRAMVAQKIKEDYLRSYFVTGNMTLGVYEDDCEFADPASSFRGLSRFQRNCTNFGSLIKRSNMNLMKWEDHEDKGIGHWRFNCVMSFPWRPILSASGFTEYFYHPQSGKVCRHVEHWNVPKMALLRQIFRPSRSLLGTRTVD